MFLLGIRGCGSGAVSSFSLRTTDLNIFWSCSGDVAYRKRGGMLQFATYYFEVTHDRNSCDFLPGHHRGVGRTVHGRASAPSGRAQVTRKNSLGSGALSHCICPSKASVYRPANGTPYLGHQWYHDIWSKQRCVLGQAGPSR